VASHGSLLIRERQPDHEPVPWRSDKGFEKSLVFWRKLWPSAATSRTEEGKGEKSPYKETDCRKPVERIFNLVCSPVNIFFSERIVTAKLQDIS
jgi:hypothetical protein